MAVTSTNWVKKDNLTDLAEDLQEQEPKTQETESEQSQNSKKQEYVVTNEDGVEITLSEGKNEYTGVSTENMIQSSDLSERPLKSNHKTTKQQIGSKAAKLPVKKPSNTGRVYVSK